MGVAQSAEHQTDGLEVLGSSPGVHLYMFHMMVILCLAAVHTLGSVILAWPLVLTNERPFIRTKMGGINLI